MTVGELFVNLGIKGSDKVGKELKNVKDGLGDVKGMSLEAKAAIIGVIYGLEKMMSSSAQMGTSLTNFTELTGMSAQSLQQWQYAARQAGVSSDELTGSLKSVQSSMTNMLLGKGAPEGLAMVANKVGFDPSRARDTLYVMQQLQKFAQSVPKDVGNNMLKSFGLSEGTISAMRRNAFRPDVFQKAPTYSDKEIGQLDKTNVAWSNLGNKIEMAIGHLTAKHGLSIVKDIERMTTGVLKLADALATLSEKSKVFIAIGWAAQQVANVMGLMSVGIDDVTGSHKKGDNEKIFGKDSAISKALNWRDSIDKSFGDFLKQGVSPNLRSQPSAKSEHVEINQTLQFQHDGKDHRKTAEAARKGVKDAYRQYQAQAQGG